MSTGEIVPIKTKVENVGKWLELDSVRAALGSALPSVGITPSRMARVVYELVKSDPGAYTKCTIESLLGAMMQCAQYGLLPGPMGFAYLIPYGTEVQFQLGYKGLVALMWRSEQISSIQAEVVYEKDTFEFQNGIPPQLLHIPSNDADRGERTWVYAVVGTKSGGWIMRCWPASQVEAHRRQYSKAGKSGKPTAWDTAWDAMACKTMLIQAGKLSPVSTECMHAMALDEAEHLGLPQDLAFELATDVTPGDSPEDAAAAQAPAAPKGAKAKAEERSAKATKAAKPKCQTSGCIRDDSHQGEHMNDAGETYSDDQVR